MSYEPVSRFLNTDALVVAMSLSVGHALPSRCPSSSRPLLSACTTRLARQLPTAPNYCSHTTRLRLHVIQEPCVPRPSSPASHHRLPIGCTQDYFPRGRRYHLVERRIAPHATWTCYVTLLKITVLSPAPEGRSISMATSGSVSVSNDTIFPPFWQYLGSGISFSDTRTLIVANQGVRRL